MSKKTENEHEGLRFLSVNVENFMGIEKVHVTIDGRSLIVFGGNRKGKSSFITALLSPLDTKIRPSTPIKQGEERSTIEITIGGQLGGEERKYMLDLYFTPGNQTGRLVMTDEKGEKVKNAATILKSLLGNISFDVYKFLNDPKDKKIETLKKLTGKGKEIDVVSLEIKEEKEKNKKLKDKVEDLEASMANHGFTDEDIEKYSKEIPLEPIQEELADISKVIETYNRVKNGLVTRKNNIDNIRKTISAREESIEAAKLKIESLKKQILAEEESIKNLIVGIDVSNDEITVIEADIEKGNNWLEGKQEPSAAEISQRLSDASVHNQNVTKVAEFAEKQKLLLKSKQDLQGLKVSIAALETKREKIISSSQLPVKGLSFTDDEITYDGLPFEKGQINTSQMLMVGAKISMALNPTLKVIFIHEASLFDQGTFQELLDIAKAEGYQVIAELVDWNKGDLEIKFAEEEI